MAQDTGRDRAWNQALGWVTNGGAVKADDLAEWAEVSERTAADVLRTMAEYGWMDKRGGNGPVHAEYVAGERLPKNLSSYVEGEEQ